MNEYEIRLVTVSTMAFSVVSFAVTLLCLSQLDEPNVTTSGLVGMSCILSASFDFAFCGVIRLWLICIRSIIREEFERKEPPHHEQ